MPSSPSTSRTYICIDLKSFYASAECFSRELDPMIHNLVVADRDRGPKTICLAITPAMKALGVRNRCRIFEIPDGIDYIMAKPRMRHYMEVSAEIYATYLNFISPDDIYAYSIDECFIEATPYLSLYEKTPREFAKMLINAVHKTTKIPATAGIGTNLFLAKVALDVTAKHSEDGIGELDEESFKREIWFHTPITDIWQIGPGIARRLAKYGAYDLASVAALNPETLYREFGVNAEFLIDHAWGQEPCTIADIKSYEPEGHSMVNGQVLPCDYTFNEARMVLREMADASVLDLVEKGLVTDHVSLMIGYAIEKNGMGRDTNTRAASNAGVDAVDPAESAGIEYNKPEFFDGGHGKRLSSGGYPAARTGGSRKLSRRTNSKHVLVNQLLKLYDETTHPSKAIRRVNIGFSGLLPEEFATFTLFDDMEAEAKEHDLQEAVIAVRNKFGKNAMLRGTSLQEKATAQERNEQVGGHHA